MTVLSDEWRDIPGYEGRYQVSDLGKVRSIGIGGNGKRGQAIRLAAVRRNGQTYLQAALYKDGIRRYFRIHQLVLLAFVGPRPVDHEVNHIDGQGVNNRLSNLEYTTRSDNLKHAFRIGRMCTDGAKNPAAILTAEQAREIYRRFHAREATGRALAAEYGVSAATVSDIAVRKSWRSLWEF